MSGDIKTIMENSGASGVENNPNAYNTMNQINISIYGVTAVISMFIAYL